MTWRNCLFLSPNIPQYHPKIPIVRRGTSIVGLSRSLTLFAFYVRGALFYRGG